MRLRSFSCHIVVIICSTLLAACPRSDQEQEKPRSSTDPFVAALGETRLTASEFVTHVALRAALSDEEFENLVEELLHDESELEAMLQEAAARKRLQTRARSIVDAVREEDEERARRGEPALFALAEEGDVTGVSEEELARVLEETRRLHAIPPEQPADAMGERLQRTWMAENTRVRGALISVPNTFRTSAINSHLTREEDAVRAWYETEGRRYFATRPQVRTGVLSLDAPAKSEVPQHAVHFARAQALAAIATPETFADLARAHSTERHAAQGGDIGWRAPDHVPGLRRGDAGDIQGPWEIGQHFMIYHIIDLKEGSVPEWDDRVARQAAHFRMREQGMSAQAEETIESLLAIEERDELTERLQEKGLRLRELPPFQRRPDDFVLDVGVAPEFSEAIFAADATSHGFLDYVHHDVNRLILFWVDEREPPDPENFEDEAEEFARRLEERLRRERIKAIDAESETVRPRVFDIEAARDALRGAILED